MLQRMDSTFPISIRHLLSFLCCLSPVQPDQADVSRFLDSLGWKRPGFNVLLYPICPDVLRPSSVSPLLSPAVYLFDFYILSFVERERIFDEHPGFSLPLCVNGLEVSLNPDTARISSL